MAPASDYNHRGGKTGVCVASAQSFAFCVQTSVEFSTLGLSEPAQDLPATSPLIKKTTTGNEPEQVSECLDTIIIKSHFTT